MKDAEEHRGTGCSLTSQRPKRRILICLVQPLGSGTVVVPFSAVTMTGTSQESRCSWSMYRARFATVLDILLDPTYTNISRGAFSGAVTARMGTGPWWSMHDDAEAFGTWRYLAAAGTTHTQKKNKQTNPPTPGRTHAPMQQSHTDTSYIIIPLKPDTTSKWNFKSIMRVIVLGCFTLLLFTSLVLLLTDTVIWSVVFSFWNESEFVVK